MATSAKAAPAQPAPAARRRAGAWLAGLFVAGAAAGSPTPGAAAECELGIVGTWASGTTAAPERIVLDFAKDGWVTLLSGPVDGPIRDYEMIGAVEYALEAGSIVFTAHRGIEMFPRGSSTWVIGSHGDESFTALDPAAERERLWTRVSTQRYFLTFAAREANESGTPAVAVLWTEVDERRARVRAMGAYPSSRDDREALFGRVPDALAAALGTESEDDADAMLRLELNEAEFRRTFEIFEAWDILLRNDLLAEDDPYVHAAELLGGVIQAANRCRAKVAYDAERFGDAVRRPREHALSGEEAEPALLVELVRHVETVNRRIHVDDEALRERPAPASE